VYGRLGSPLHHPGVQFVVGAMARRPHQAANRSCRSGAVGGVRAGLGHLESRSTAVEDLAESIQDTQARIEMLTTYRKQLWSCGEGDDEYRGCHQDCLGVVDRTKRH